MLIELTRSEQHHVSGGIWNYVAIGIAVADAAYEFYQGYSDHRR